MNLHDQYRKEFIRELGQMSARHNVVTVFGDAVDMTFVELTLLGYAARVDHMNALSMQVLSPARYTLGYYLHGIQWRTAA